MRSSQAWRSICTTVNPSLTDALALVAVIREAVPTEWGRARAEQGPVVPFSTSGSQAEKVFVTWAHRDEGWSEDEERDWQTQVSRFVVTLRTNGIDADVDLFHLEDKSIDWTRFGPQKVHDADTVLIVMSRAWAERWEGRNSPRVGAGAVGEADELKGLFARDQEQWQRKCSIVMFPDVASDVVPAGLERLARFPLDPHDLPTYEGLFRALTAQPSYEMPPLGPVPVLPPKVAAGSGNRVDQWIALRDQQRRANVRKRAAGVSDEQAEQMVSRESLVQGVIDALRET